MQLNFLNLDFKHPGTTMLNLAYKFKLSDGIDLDRFSRALSKEIKSRPVFASVIEKRGSEFYIRLQKDYELRNSMTFEEDREFFISRYRKENYDAIPRVDFDLKENVDAQIAKPFPFSKNEVKEFCKKTKIGENAFYCAAFALSVCQYNHSQLVRFGWIWNGRKRCRIHEFGRRFYSRDSHCFFDGKRKKPSCEFGKCTKAD